MKPLRSITSFATTAAISFGALTAFLSSNACAQACPGDLNGDGQVNGADLGALLATWGICPVLAPTISSVNPNYGPQTGGTVFVINGTNLNGATSVTVGGVAATITVVSPTAIAATAPASATLGAKDVIVTTPGGTATAVGAFTYNSSSVPSWATVIEFAPNPAVVTNATMRAAITATGLAWRVRDTGTQVEMLLVPPGSFTMGCTASNLYACSSNENPTHSVTLTQAFYMGRYEVTQSQWVAKMGSNPSYHQGSSYPDAANRPVEQVTWNNIQGYLSATGMRLPSEAEWEYACRAGTTTAFNNGSSDDATVGTIAWYTTNSGSQTRVVGGKAANALGLYDMSGNVWEWVSDWYDGTYYSVSPSTNPPGPVSGTNRVLRSGAFVSGTDLVRSSYRFSRTPDGTNVAIGFRVARTP
jgi:formylglycine-generating enzyme required for sulfatase activity